jgi:hypothetical protein
MFMMFKRLNGRSALLGLGFGLGFSLTAAALSSAAKAGE